MFHVYLIKRTLPETLDGTPGEIMFCKKAERELLVTLKQQQEDALWSIHD